MITKKIWFRICSYFWLLMSICRIQLRWKAGNNIHQFKWILFFHKIEICMNKIHCKTNSPKNVILDKYFNHFIPKIHEFFVVEIFCSVESVPKTKLWDKFTFYIWEFVHSVIIFSMRKNFFASSVLHLKTPFISINNRINIFGNRFNKPYRKFIGSSGMKSKGNNLQRNLKIIINIFRPITFIMKFMQFEWIIQFLIEIGIHHYQMSFLWK